ncbi:ribonuclease G [Amphibacillus marinus]|uniref:Ribonuclease G n=1 Tax=Amphibacillus marinus TaxID=872970 RepID=A0A1H8P2A6_9BACI|nr:ribonuclease E/G [Amphibacillus marinus]SEO35891.1 ribonuclease G [Amphibacillus marinus]
MINLILLTKAAEQIGCAIEDNQVIELALDRPNSPQLVGSIFLGKVVAVDKGLQAAFIDIGQPALAYIERKELVLAEKEQAQTIEELLVEGASLVVQVIKDAYQNKGARLTANVTLANDCLVFLPYGNKITISRKLDKQKNTDLKQNLKSSLLGNEGLIIRTQASGRTAAELIKSIAVLRQQWSIISKAALETKAGQLIWRDTPVINRFVRRFPLHEIQSIVCDDNRTVKAVSDRYPLLEEKLIWNQQAAVQLPQSVDQLFARMLEPTVLCQHGVTLVIEQTEALTVVDVNSSGYSGKRNHHNTALEVNKIAAQELARQLRLRNLSGIIIIDFIKMKSKKDQQYLINLINQCLKADSVQTTVFNFTSLGLLELTRKRESPAHAHVLADARPEKKVLSVESRVYQLERELIASRDEAVVVEVTKQFKELWRAWVQLAPIRADVYFVETRGVACYFIKRTGSSALIQAFLLEKKQQNIDKIY